MTSWREDPEIQATIRKQGVRTRLIRSAILWTPLFALALGAFLFWTFDTAFLGGDNGGTWVLVVILAIVTTLFGFQSIQSILDLLGKPATETGYVTRRWAKSDSLVIRSHYMRMGARILRGDAYTLADIKAGDYVEATFYPHSAVLIWAEKVPDPAAAVAEGATPTPKLP